MIGSAMVGVVFGGLALSLLYELRGFAARVVRWVAWRAGARRRVRRQVYRAAQFYGTPRGKGLR